MMVSKANQTISFTAIAAKTVGNVFNPSATATSGLPVTYTICDTTVVIVTSTGLIQVVGAGSAIITASQAGDGNYNPALDQTQAMRSSGASHKAQFLTITTPIDGFITNNPTLIISGSALNINKNKNSAGVITINNSTPTFVIPNNTGYSTFSHTMTLLDDINTITTEATDYSGTSTTTDTRSVVLDRTVPLLTLSTLVDGAVTKNATLNVSGSATDSFGIKEVTVNGT